LKMRCNRITGEIERDHYLMLSKMNKRSVAIQKPTSPSKVCERHPRCPTQVKFPLVKILSFACHSHAKRPFSVLPNCRADI
jgi:hypothetical protein